MNAVKMHKQETHESLLSVFLSFCSDSQPYSESLHQPVNTNPLMLVLGQKIRETKETEETGQLNYIT